MYRFAFSAHAAFAQSKISVYLQKSFVQHKSIPIALFLKNYLISQGVCNEPLFVEFTFSNILGVTSYSS